jgi:hypothetical protein
MLDLARETLSLAASGCTSYGSDLADNGRFKPIHDVVITGTPGSAASSVTGGQTDNPTNYRYNYLPNGGMDFIQRWPVALTANNGSAPLAQTATGRQPAFDRMGLTVQTPPDCQFGRIDAITTPISGSVSRYYAQFKEVSAAGKIIISWTLTAKETANLRGKYVRFQAKIATGAWGSASNLRMGILALGSGGTQDTIPATFATQSVTASVDPTWGTNLTAIAPTLVDGGNLFGAGGASIMQIPNPGVSAVFSRYGVVCLVPATALNIVCVLYTDSQMAINDVLNVTEAGLYLGQEIVDWNPMSPEQEAERVLTDYCKTFEVDTAPVQNATIGTGEWSFVETIAGAAANVSGRFLFPVPMRVSPTVTFYNPAAANAFVRDVTHSADCTVTTAVNTTSKGVSLTCTPTSAGTVGGDLRVHLSAETASTTWC